jgi:hypothetical protein
MPTSTIQCPLKGEVLVISVRCHRRLATIAAFAVVLLGCTKQPVGPPRGTVHGKITLDGMPIATGTIAFAPTGPAAGPACGLPLKDGQYASDAKGPIVGKNRVEIRAPRDSGKTPEDGDWKSNYIESIPVRYNTQSTLEFDVHPGDNTFDVELKSQ